MDSNNINKINLDQLTQFEKYSTASARRAKVYDAKERGYYSIKLPEDLMDTLNQNFGVRETLSNSVKFTSTSEFVFQNENVTKKKIDISKTSFFFSGFEKIMRIIEKTNTLVEEAIVPSNLFVQIT